VGCGPSQASSSFYSGRLRAPASAKHWFLGFFSVSNNTVDSTHVHLGQQNNKKSNVLVVTSIVFFIHFVEMPSILPSPLQGTAWFPSVLLHSHQPLFRCSRCPLNQTWLRDMPSMLLRLLLRLQTRHQSLPSFLFALDLPHPLTGRPDSSRCFSQSRSSCLVNCRLGSAAFVFGFSSW